MTDFFVSYNKADGGWAEWISWQLEEAGYEVVIQAWDFRPGSNFVLEMQKASADAQRTIAVLSPDYLTSEMTQPEWAAAFVQDPTGSNRKLVPVRVRECDVEGLLGSIVYIDLADHPETAAKAALLDGVAEGRSKPDTAPAFPRGAQRSTASAPAFPGGLPSIWNVPHLRNPNFTGREGLLDDLRKSLASGQAAAVTQAIAGLGGVGKTQLATEYAYRYASEYDAVWWVRSEESATLGADYAALAGELGLPESEATDQSVAVQAVRRWLEGNPRWLLVLDNAPGPAEARDYVPRGATGHVIITSRHRAWADVASPLSLQVFERAESVRFLLDRTGETDEDAADALADELGDLPLALAHAAAYVEETGRSLAGYLELFRGRRQDLLARGDPSAQYSASVAAAFELSFERLEAVSPVGAALLSLAAFMAPDDIPTSLISEGAEHLLEPLDAAAADPLELDDALAALRRSSLAEAAEQSMSVHRLVQAVVRDRLDDDDKKAWAASAVGLVNAAFPYEREDPATWAASGRLLPHALASAGYAEAVRVAPAATAELLDGAGRYLRLRARLSEAQTVLGRGLAIDEKTYGPGHPTVATRVNNLGLVLLDVGNLEGARDHFERALAILEKAYGPDHSEVATSVNNLGNVLHDLGDLEGAREHYERALAMGEKTFGPQHPSVALRVNNLGNLLQDLGDLEGARAHCERALAIGEKTFGPDHPTVALRVNNLGGILRGLGDLEGAKPQFERALAIDETAYGPDHPTVAIDLNNLGNVLRDLGDLEGARDHFERALAISEKAYGPHHPTVAIRVNNLGNVLRDQGDLDGARDHYERALAISEKTYGPDHPTVASASTTWAACCGRRATWRAPGTTTSGRWPSSRSSWARTTPAPSPHATTCAGWVAGRTGGACASVPQASEDRRGRDARHHRRQRQVARLRAHPDGRAN